MALPPQVFLRQTDGAAIGPLALTALEVLYDAHLVDEGTPISSDGQGYRSLGDWPGLVERMQTVKEALGRGEDPWPDELPEPPPSSQARTSSASQDLAPSSSQDLPPPTRQKNLVGMLVTKAIDHATGIIQFGGEEGEIDVSVRDGKVVAVSTSIPRLVLSEHLMEAGLVDAAALAKAENNASAVGGDLGASLVAQGLLEPHVYFEALGSWAKNVLGEAASGAHGEAEFEGCDVDNPSVPFGFDRMGLAMEVVRQAFDLPALKERLLPQKRCPLVISQVEGAKPEDFKLQPRELRVLNKVNGVFTLQDVMNELGGSDDKDLALLRGVFFGEQAGFIAIGDDVAARRERAEAARLEEKLARLSQQTDFEILGIDEKSSDEDVRARFTELAKQYHPDKISPDAEPTLINVRRKLFAIVSAAFERQETEDRRYSYANELEVGAHVQGDEASHVQNVLHSETAFEKAKVLLRLRKYDEALEEIKVAITLNPTDTEFKIQREYIKYLLDTKNGKGTEAARAAIKQVFALMQNDANIASGYLVLGHLHKAVGKSDVAVRYFEKVLEYDEHHVEAQQEVRVANLRKERGKKKKRWL